MTEVSPGNFQADDAGRPDYLMRNEGGPGLPRFLPAAPEAGISHRGFGLSAHWWDFDDDGWLDLFVGNDYNDPDYLYRNRGDGTFQNVAPRPCRTPAGSRWAPISVTWTGMAAVIS